MRITISIYLLIIIGQFSFNKHCIHNKKDPLLS